MPSPVIRWHDDKTLFVNDTRFLVTFEDHEMRNTVSTPTHFVVGKARSMIERLVTLGAAARIENILDIGIFKGGSVALYDQLFAPRKIVALEYSAEPVTALSDYIAAHGKSGSVRPYYGVNQGDRPAVEAILAAEFPLRDIDLVVDDASHLYEETRGSFNVAFPYMRAGAHYIVEDWAWAHWPPDFWQNDTYFGDRPALSNLLVELFMLAASRPDLISQITVDYSMIIVSRGAGNVPAGSFDIRDHYRLRGKSFQPWL